MKESLLFRLDSISERYEELAALMSEPEVITDQNKFREFSKEYAEIEPVVKCFASYKQTLDDIQEAKVLMDDGDADMREMAEEEWKEAKSALETLEMELQTLLLPKDPNDGHNVFLEIRAGTGGDEAAIFSGDLFRMYSKYCESKGWKVSTVDYSEGTNGGFKEIQFEVTGDDVYGILKFEAGVHRVQRVPQTETQGRVHTSAATCMVFPEAEEFDVEINPKEVRIDFFCSSGPGGQSVNTTYSAVRLTHIPTGLVAQCQDQKSQHKNKEKAFKVLRSRLYDLELAKKQAEDAEKRGSMVTSGDRSAKIRTYNYPQGRVTDHRINLTLYKLAEVMEGSLSEVIEPLRHEHQADLLAAMGD